MKNAPIIKKLGSIPTLNTSLNTLSFVELSKYGITAQETKSPVRISRIKKFTIVPIFFSFSVMCLLC